MAEGGSPEWEYSCPLRWEAHRASRHLVCPSTGYQETEGQRQSSIAHTKAPKGRELFDLLEAYETG